MTRRVTDAIAQELQVRGRAGMRNERWPVCRVRRDDLVQVIHLWRTFVGKHRLVKAMHAIPPGFRTRCISLNSSSGRVM